MNSLAELRLGDIVRGDHRRAEILEEYNLDFCCGGKKTLRQACEDSNLDLTEIQEKLAKVSTGNSNIIDFNYLEVDQLCDYIERKHHTYIRKNIPVLLTYVNKVFAVHGKKYPQIGTVLNLFIQVSYDLQEHMEKEEVIMFPLIRKLNELHYGSARDVEPSVRYDLIHNIGLLTDDHEKAGGLMNDIKNLTNDYLPPESACNTHRVMLAKLREFEQDLHVHVHLENNVLFPKAQLLTDNLILH